MEVFGFDQADYGLYGVIAHDAPDAVLRTPQPTIEQLAAAYITAVDGRRRLEATIENSSAFPLQGEALTLVEEEVRNALRLLQDHDPSFGI
jgi:hypothetical protein